MLRRPSLKLIAARNQPPNTKILELISRITELFAVVAVVVYTLPTPTFAIVQTTWLRIRVEVPPPLLNQYL